MKKVIILLATYNGEKYLKEQLDSLFNQTHKNIEVYARDDNSKDSTLDILRSYPIKVLEKSSNLGARDSFAKLLEVALKDSDGEYFMFCDQDDFWKENKIEKTLNKMLELESKNNNIPILIHTDLEVVDKDLNTISNSMWEYEQIIPKHNSFNRLLIQNTITGCTVMINKDLALKSIPVSNKAVMHDWWLGLVASCFGKIGYLNDTTIKYRQHGNNTIGAKENKNTNIIRLVIRLLYSLIKNILGRDRNYIKDLTINKLQAEGFYEQYKDDLDSDVRKLLIEFINIENKNFFYKRFIIFKYKLYKQSFVNNIALLIKI